MASQRLSNYHLNFNIAYNDQKKPLHYTTPCIIYVQKGHGILKIEEEIHKLTAGDCFLAPLALPVSYWATSENGWEYIWGFFDGPMFQEILIKTGFSATNPVCRCNEEQQALFAELYENRFFYHGKEYYAALEKMVHLCASFIDTLPSEEQPLSDNSIRSITNFIKNNVDRTDLSVDLLMKVSGLGRTSLFQKFKNAGYPSISHYIRDIRISKAKLLLRSTELPVSQIAFAVGMEDPLYFSRVFKKAVGGSPSRYRLIISREKSQGKDEKNDL